MLAAADQRRERTPRGKISINAVAVDPMRPHLFVTGSNDPLGKSKAITSGEHVTLCM